MAADVDFLLHLVDRAERGALLPEEAPLLRRGIRQLAEAASARRKAAPAPDPPGPRPPAHSPSEARTDPEENPMAPSPVPEPAPRNGEKAPESPEPGSQVSQPDPPSPDASDGRTAAPEERAALDELIHLAQADGLYDTPHPHAAPGSLRSWLAGQRDRAARSAAAARNPESARVNEGMAAAFGEVIERLDRVHAETDEERLARWRSVICRAWDLDEQVAGEIARAAIREADEEHAGLQLACAEEAARAAAHLEGVAAEADGWQRRYETAAAAVLAARRLAEALAAEHPAIARRITAALNTPMENQ